MSEPAAPKTSGLMQLILSVLGSTGLTGVVIYNRDVFLRQADAYTILALVAVAGCFGLAAWLLISDRNAARQVRENAIKEQAHLEGKKAGRQELAKEIDEKVPGFILNILNSIRGQGDLNAAREATRVAYGRFVQSRSWSDLSLLISEINLDVDERRIDFVEGDRRCRALTLIAFLVNTNRPLPDLRLQPLAL